MPDDQGTDTIPSVSTDLLIAQRSIQLLYRHILGREVSPEEMDAAYTNNPLVQQGDINAVVEDLFSSQEYRDVRATLARTADIEDCVRLLYRQLLRREISSEEMRSFRNNQDFASGNMLPLLTDFLTSDEYAQAKAKAARDAFNPREARKFIYAAYRLAFGRTPAEEEYQVWLKHLAAGKKPEGLINDFLESEEAFDFSHLGGDHISPEWLFWCAIVSFKNGIGLSLASVEEYLKPVRDGRLTMLRSLKQVIADGRLAMSSTGSLNNFFYMLGTTSRYEFDVWDSGLPVKIEAPPVHHAKADSTHKGIEVSAIASLYKGDDFIESFLDNIVNQTIFKERCELIIIDAASPGNEYEVIAPYLKTFDNIRYTRTDKRIGIYEAWNLGISLARGRFITNTNLDDLRRRDSFEIQRSLLLAHEHVDVVYQDFYYSMEQGLTFEEIAAHGILCRLPVINMNGLVSFNSPHNAPMWRKAIHSDVGLFDPSYKSAGDCDLWIRSLLAGKTFFKSNDPHVAYYINPEGISTSADSPGVREHAAIMRRLSNQILPAIAKLGSDEFAEMLGASDLRTPPGKSKYELVQDQLLDLGWVNDRRR